MERGQIESELAACPQKGHAEALVVRTSHAPADLL